MESFRVVQAFYRAPVALTHAQRVTRLYRAALRTLDSWACDREIFLTRGEEIRARFNAHKTADPACVWLLCPFYPLGEALPPSSHHSPCTTRHPPMLTLAGAGCLRACCARGRRS